MYYEEEIEILNKRVEDALEYIKENPKSNPNAYELMELTIRVGNISSKVRKNTKDVYGVKYVFSCEDLNKLRENYFKMMKERLKSLKKLCGKKDALYEMFEGKIDAVTQYTGFDYDEEKTIFLCKLAKTSLYTKQRIKYLIAFCKCNDEVIFDNEEELCYLINKYNLLVYKADPEIKTIRRVIKGIVKCYKKYV